MGSQGTRESRRRRRGSEGRVNEEMNWMREEMLRLNVKRKKKHFQHRPTHRSVNESLSRSDFNESPARLFCG